jgi:hypothetical protein
MVHSRRGDLHSGLFIIHNHLPDLFYIRILSILILQHTILHTNICQLLSYIIISYTITITRLLSCSKLLTLQQLIY